MTQRIPLVAGNWKMFGSLATNETLARGLRAEAHHYQGVELLVCPPLVYLQSVGHLLAGSPIAVGAQNLSEHDAHGAMTGEVHGNMLTDIGCRYVIVGHSERRALHRESSELVAAKTKAAIAVGLKPIVCIGETLEERESGATTQVLTQQLAAVLKTCSAGALAHAVIAYEPVWAIGTGRTASPAQAQEVHAELRRQIAAVDAKLADSMRILYGGSVKPDNAASLFTCPDIDGGLIGGASLKATDFLAIAAAAQLAKGTAPAV